MIVRGYYEVYVDEDEVDVNNKKEVIERAKTLFGYDIQDRCVYPDSMTWKIAEKDMEINMYNAKVRKAMSENYVKAKNERSMFRNELFEISQKLTNEEVINTISYNEYIGLKQKAKMIEYDITALNIEINIWDKAREICMDIADEEARLHMEGVTEKDRTVTLTDEEIDCFNEYLESEKVSIPFGNTDWNSIYRKIVGDKVSNYAKDQMNKYIE